MATERELKYLLSKDISKKQLEKMNAQGLITGVKDIEQPYLFPENGFVEFCKQRDVWKVAISISGQPYHFTVIPKEDDIEEIYEALESVTEENLTADDKWAIRIREYKGHQNRYVFTLKKPKPEPSVDVYEFEAEIILDDYTAIEKFCRQTNFKVIKTRYEYPYQGRLAEHDVIEGTDFDLLEFEFEITENKADFKLEGIPGAKCVSGIKEFENKEIARQNGLAAAA